MEKKIDLPKRKSWELAETYAEKLTLQTVIYARRNRPGKKAWPKLAETFAKKLEANFGNQTWPKSAQARKSKICQMKPLAHQNLNESHEANFRDLSKFDTKLLNQKHEPIFEKQRFGKLLPLKVPNFVEQNFC